MQYVFHNSRNFVNHSGPVVTFIWEKMPRNVHWWGGGDFVGVMLQFLSKSNHFLCQFWRPKSQLRIKLSQNCPEVKGLITKMCKFLRFFWHHIHIFWIILHIYAKHGLPVMEYNLLIGKKSLCVSNVKIVTYHQILCLKVISQRFFSYV